MARSHNEGDDDGWMSTPLLPRPFAKEGRPRSGERDAPQTGRLESHLIFLASAATLFFLWLAIRDSALLEQISSWRPKCFLVSCETQTQPHREAQAQPEPKSQPQPQPQVQPQPQAQHQTQPRPQPPRHPPPPRPHMLDRVVVGECPTCWVRYSPRLSEPQAGVLQSNCWRDRSIRGRCFN